MPRGTGRTHFLVIENAVEEQAAGQAAPPLTSLSPPCGDVRSPVVRPCRAELGQKSLHHLGLGWERLLIDDAALGGDGNF